MTAEDIQRMAREAGLQPYYDEQVAAIARFAALVASAEREACAKACESLFDMDDDSSNEAEQCAEAIRARSNK